MNNTENAKDSKPKVSTEQLVVDAGEMIGEFERLLASESYLLETGQAKGLQAIAEAKDVLVGKLSKHEHMLINIFEHEADLPAVAGLKARLVKCRVDNQNNHALVMLELKHANKSLELLRSVLRMDDLSLYSERGTVNVNREKRRFGSA